MNQKKQYSIKNLNLIAPYLSLLLDEAESRFGQCTSEYRFAGVQFTERGPMISYFNKNNFVIELTESTLTYLPQFFFQLSHEIIHYLHPSGGENANNLEEGLATYFSINHKMVMVKEVYANVITTGRYSKQYKIVNELINEDPNCIKKLRKLQPSLSSVTEEMIHSVFDGKFDHYAKFLITRFTPEIRNNLR